jgi:crossover junction endodeoxyribonuclease RuvC
MIALGIDPGIAICGYGVVREERDGSLKPLAFGVITTPKEQALPQRLQTLHTELNQLIEAWKPAESAIEELFFVKNVKTGITVAQARGVVMLTLADCGVPIHEYKPTIVKQAITGYGNADKAQMQEMVRMLLGLNAIPKPDDAAAALGVAIAHIQSRKWRALERLG